MTKTRRAWPYTLKKTASSCTMFKEYGNLNDDILLVESDNEDLEVEEIDD